MLFEFAAHFKGRWIKNLFTTCKFSKSTFVKQWMYKAFKTELLILTYTNSKFQDCDFLGGWKKYLRLSHLYLLNYIAQHIKLNHSWQQNRPWMHPSTPATQRNKNFKCTYLHWDWGIHEKIIYDELLVQYWFRNLNQGNRNKYNNQ